MPLAEQMARQPLLRETGQVISFGSDFNGRASGGSQCLTLPSLRGLSQFVP